MYVLDNERAKTILIQELGYTRISAESFLRDFPPVHNELAGAVRQWLDDRTVLDVSVFGLSISEYMRIRHAHFLMAVRDLNRLLDADLTPERRERLIKILQKPVIRW